MYVYLHELPFPHPLHESADEIAYKRRKKREERDRTVAGIVKGLLNDGSKREKRRQ